MSEKTYAWAIARAGIDTSWHLIELGPSDTMGNSFLPVCFDTKDPYREFCTDDFFILNPDEEKLVGGRYPGTHAVCSACMAHALSVALVVRKPLLLSDTLCKLLDASLVDEPLREEAEIFNINTANAKAMIYTGAMIIDGLQTQVKNLEERLNKIDHQEDRSSRRRRRR